ncbi:MAG: hypothetical protein ACJAWM_000832 [Sulfitobacter sp.]|jgi:hypothetical protein
MFCCTRCWKLRRSSGEAGSFSFEENGPEFSKIPWRRVMLERDLSIGERISALIEAELVEAMQSQDMVFRRTAEAFRKTLRQPRQIKVNFSGGITQLCWSVSRGDGTYRVVYMPRAGYFSLCVESDFGPLDIGVHGPALGCFGSV